MARFKGLVLLNARDFCVERFGETGWGRVVDTLDAADHAVVASAVHVGWYDIGLYDRVHEAIDRTLGHDDRSVMTNLGHWCAEHDLTTVHRVFLRMASPAMLLRTYGAFWRRYQDSGDWSVKTEGDRRVRATLANWGSTSEPTCIRIAAYVERFLDLVGARGTRVSRQRCRSRGDDVCEYVADWTSGAVTSTS